MARPPKSPVFLADSSYRQRRLRDALRLLPVLGGAAWLIPILWPRGAEGGVLNSQALLYIFIVWLGLIGLSMFLTSRLRSDEQADAPARSLDGEDLGE